MSIRVLAVLAIALTCGCAPHRQSPSKAPAPGPNHPSGDIATLYVLRPSTPPVLLKPSIYLDGRKLSDLPNNTYITTRITSGEHQIVSDWSTVSGIPDSSADFSVENGSNYYVLVSTDMALLSAIPLGKLMLPGGKSKASTTVVPEEIARELLKKCKLHGNY